MASRSTAGCRVEEDVGADRGTSQWTEWWGVVLSAGFAAFGFSVLRGPALALPSAALVAIVVQVARIRSRGVVVADGRIVVSRWRSTLNLSADRCRLRFVNLEDYGRVMSPVLEELDQAGQVSRRVTLSEIRFVDDPLWRSDEQFRSANFRSIELYERIAAAVADADTPARWMNKRR